MTEGRPGVSLHDPAETDESYSYTVKREIIHTFPHMRCCQETFMAALTETQRQGICLLWPPRLHDETDALISGVVPGDIELEEQDGRFFVSPASAPLFEEMRHKRLAFSEYHALRPHCAASFLKALFIRGGYIQDPRQRYHIEISLTEQFLADFFRKCCHRLKISFHSCEKDKHEIAYIKNRSGIRKFFSALELFDRVLDFDDVLETRALIGQVNRQVNFETANLQKSVSASGRLSRQISELFEYPDQDFWTDCLRFLAKKRLEFPFDSLEDLGKRLRPPISKSAVNHRLRRIAALHLQMFGDRMNLSGENDEPTQAP
jgi:hypothetical protein